MFIWKKKYLSLRLTEGWRKKCYTKKRARTNRSLISNKTDYLPPKLSVERLFEILQFGFCFPPKHFESQFTVASQNVFNGIRFQIPFLDNTAVKRIAHVQTSRPNENKSAAWPAVLNIYSFFGKALNEMVNQKNTRNLISFVFGSLKFFFCVIAFPFTVFYDTCNLFFVNFVVSTVFFPIQFCAGNWLAWRADVWPRYFPGPFLHTAGATEI